MSESAKRLFDTLRAMGGGLQSGLMDGLKQVGVEVQRLGTQGSMEIASVLYNGHGFVPYGPGQYTPSPEHHNQQQQQQQHDRGVER